MIFNYLKIGWRNLIRHKSYSIINILGLSVGFCSSILILLWIQHELSFDKFHQDHKNIFRVTAQVEQVKAAISPAPLAPGLENQYSEIGESVRLNFLSSHLFLGERENYLEEAIYYVDSNFLSFFDFPLLYGAVNEALAKPQNIVITKSQAIKYFGKENAIGEIMQLDNRDEFVVSGILDDIPSTSHLKFNILMPFTYLARTEEDIRENRWDNFNYYSYVKVDNNHLGATSIAHLEDLCGELYTANEDQLKVSWYFQPLDKIHLHSDFLGDVAGQGNVQYVYIFGCIALFILVIAAINFMNLATARSSRRAREVGFRKVAGARRFQLVFQFLSESTLLAVLALFLAIAGVYFLLPGFNILTGKDISLLHIQPLAMLVILLLTVSIGMLAGIYPAVYLSSFVPVKVLSMQSNSSRGHRLFRNALVVTQFVFSIVLIIGTFIVQRQQQFIKEQNIGFDKENLVYIKINGELRDKQESLRNALRQNHLTENFTIVDGLPTDLLSGTIDVVWDGKDPGDQYLFSQLDADEHFIDVFGIKMRSGRPFSEEMNDESSAYLLNEKALELMEMNPDSAIGQSFALWHQEGSIVGVMEDFHFKPIQQPIEPLVLRYRQFGDFAVIRTQPQQLEASLKQLEEICTDMNPAYPIEYGFVDQDLENLYQSEKQLGKLINIFTFLAIFIACLGLYGLSAFLAEQRKKEIGVRKVVGASIFQLIYILSRDFTKPIWLAMLIAIPVAWYAGQQWLQNFAYHIDLKWPLFLFACLVSWGIALFTVSFESIKAALNNPIEALNKE